MRKMNQMRLEFDACPENEAFARVVVSAFAVRLNPTVEQIADVKTAVSEAVTNAIVHGYRGRPGKVSLAATVYDDGRLVVEVGDKGCGIQDVEQAMQPFFTTQPEMERSGMGFAVMQSFMDAVEVDSAPGLGTTVRMTKHMLGEELDERAAHA